MRHELYTQGHGSREGIGGKLPPPNFAALGVSYPPSQKKWTVDVVHFYFGLFLHVNLGPSKKIVGQIRGVFGFE